MTKTTYRQGDIVLIPYPYDDLSSVKKRPVIILSKDEINRDSFIVVKVTSVVRRDEFSFLLIDEELSLALPKPSEVRTHQLFSAHKTLIIKKISSLNLHALSRLSNRVQEHIRVPGE